MEKNFREYLTETKKNSDVIKDFVAGKTSGSSLHLYIEKRSSGRVLINYRTILVYKPNDEDMFFMNSTKYSVTTSKIQGYIRGALSDTNYKQMPEEELRDVMDEKEEGEEEKESEGT